MRTIGAQPFFQTRFQLLLLVRWVRQHWMEDQSGRILSKSTDTIGSVASKITSSNFYWINSKSSVKWPSRRQLSNTRLWSIDSMQTSCKSNCSCSQIGAVDRSKLSILTVLVRRHMAAQNSTLTTMSTFRVEIMEVHIG